MARWSKIEESYLRDRYAYDSVKSIAKDLQRSERSVFSKAHRLGIGRQSALTPSSLWMQCYKCERVLPQHPAFFSFSLGNATGYCYICKACSALQRSGMATQHHHAREMNGEKFCYKCERWLPATSEYFDKRRLKVDSSLSFCSPCKKCRREWMRSYCGVYLDNNVTQKLSQRMSQAMWKSLVNGKHGHHWETLVDYTLDELKTHLEEQMHPWMTWDNYGRCWHIDHIRPVSSFSFESYNDPEFKKCWRLRNLQPMWAGDNFRKSDTWDRQTQLF